MAADLSIHILKPPCDESILARFFCHTLGSKYFALRPGFDEEAHLIVADTPSVHVGEVSWLKAALFEDSETFVPAPVQAVHEIIGEDLPAIDDALIARIRAALGLENRTGYDVSAPDPIIAFLEEHRGERAFTVSW